MIVTVTASPTLDVAYGVAEPLTPGADQQTASQLARPGGKGLSITRMLASLDESVEATGMAGGPGGIALRSALNDHEISHDFVDVLPDVRRTITIRDSSGVSTSIHEQEFSPDNPRQAVRLLVKTVQSHLDRARVVTVCGGGPPHVDSRMPALITQVADRAGKHAVADVSGIALRDVLQAGTAVLVTNVSELEAVEGRQIADDHADVAGYCRDLITRYGLPAIVTLTSRGVVATYGDGAWWSQLAQPHDDFRSAGRAVCAAVTRHLANHKTPDWQEVSTDAAALAASAAPAPDEGQIDLKAYLDLKPAVATQRL